MKKLFKYLAWLVPGIFLCFSTTAQITKTSQFSTQQRNSINSTLNSQYKGVDTNKIQWKQNENGEYEGSFRYKNRDLRSTFDNDGNWIGTSERIGLNDLPENVKNNALTEYGVEGVQTVDRYTNSDREVYYDITPVGEKKPVRYTIEGTVLNY